MVAVRYPRRFLSALTRLRTLAVGVEAVEEAAGASNCDFVASHDAMDANHGGLKSVKVAPPRGFEPLAAPCTGALTNGLLQWLSLTASASVFS